MRSRRTLLRVLAVVAALGLVGAACQRQDEPTNQDDGEKEQVKIAFFGALSGDYKLLVIHGYQAAQLAFDKANAGEFGELPVEIELVPHDTQGSGDQAAPLVDKVINDDSYVGVIGPAFSGESAAVGDRLDQAGLPFITPSATDDALATNGWTHWFRGVGNNSDQAKPAAAYIQNVIAPSCTFVASDGSAYGHGLAAIVETNLSDAGAKVQPEEQVQPGGKDYSALVTKIEGSGCGAVFYGGYSPEAGLIRKQMSEAGLDDVVLVGGDGIKDDAYLEAAGDASEGSISMCPCVAAADLLEGEESEVAQDFLDSYEEEFGEAPGIYAAEGWDIANIFIEAFKADTTDREGITEYIRNLNGYLGLAKTYTFQPDGELLPSSRTMYAYEATGGAWEFLGDANELSAPAE